MDQTSINREFVRRHFEAVNRRDVQPVLGNMRPDLYDHEIEGDHKNDLDEGAQRLQVLMKQVPDLTVDVRDVIADGDKVVVRAVWFGTDAVSRRKVGFHGFVQWRIVEGKFAERWATVTPLCGHCVSRGRFTRGGARCAARPGWPDRYIHALGKRDDTMVIGKAENKDD